MPAKYRVGNLEFALLSDGTFYQDAGTVFGIVPRVLWERYAAELDDSHRMSLALNSLLLRSQGRLILIETGIGDKEYSRRQSSSRSGRTLLTDLSELGIQPNEIDVVINTHLHGDHCGWNTRSVGGHWVPTFANAVYMVRREEWEAAVEPNERTRGTYFTENLLPLKEQERLQLLDGETKVTDEVTVVPTPGHSAGHASVVLSSAGETAIYVGDIAITAVQLERTAWVSAFDIMPLVTMETKRALVERAISEGSLLIGAHLPGVGRIIRTDRGLRQWKNVDGENK
jgi:glyoxylase-like metal-dependent hydrolase (beta-lactamase superfamily II)